MKEVLKLREKTGCSLQECKNAIEYCKGKKDVTPIGFLKAKTIAVCTHMNFYDRVKFYSRGEIN